MAPLHPDLTIRSNVGLESSYLSFALEDTDQSFEVQIDAPFHVQRTQYYPTLTLEDTG